MPHLIDLPTDIFYSIFPYLSAADFLSFTSSSKSLYNFHQDPTVWRVLTRSTFRIPPQPLLQADGARWQWLYKNLCTRTRLFTWGNNNKGNLGHDGWKAKKAALPMRVKVDDEVGVIADVQCGGWSTTLLNSIGVIHAFGIVNGLDTFHNPINSYSRKLLFPPSYPLTTHDRYEPQTAIQQFSTGRSHVLGLADNGNVWFWCKEIAFLVRPVDMDLAGKTVTRVVAGWDRSSIYINDVGIVFWTPNLKPSSDQSDLDVVSMETTLIPDTGFRRKRNNRMLYSTLEVQIGEVTNHIALEGYIVFITDLNKIFAYQTASPISDLNNPEPVELTTFYPDSPSTPFQIRDIQGSFRSFAIFTTSGSVLTASRSLIDTFFSESEPFAEPTKIPALQGKSIISISFGDHHFHALRANGTITSHGTECNACGSLGLGNDEIAKLRGVRYERWPRDGTLEPGTGRTVWFERMMVLWLRDMVTKSKSAEAQERGRWFFRTGHAGASQAMGDYFEREGARWEEGITAEDELGAYFVLKVSAAGWHSAALVLVDEEKAEQARRKHKVVTEGFGEMDGVKDERESYTWAEDPFPRLRMEGGEVMPGDIDVMD